VSHGKHGEVGGAAVPGRGGDGGAREVKRGAGWYRRCRRGRCPCAPGER
jgi:hypothetical protein